ncbi:MAG: pilus assembly protein [Bacteroidota bacterium]
MKNILIDAGPLIALFDKSDQYHQSAVSFLKTFEGQLFTTWPVITEVSHMLDFSTKAQTDLLEWMSRGGLQLFPLDESSAYRLMALTKKFDDVPMDLADASLIIASEELNILEIASIDSDFYVYRTIRNDYLTNIFPLMKNA